MANGEEAAQRVFKDFRFRKTHISLKKEKSNSLHFLKQKELDTHMADLKIRVRSTLEIQVPPN